MREIRIPKGEPASAETQPPNAGRDLSILRSLHPSPDRPISGPSPIPCKGQDRLPRTRTETPGKKEQQGLLDAARDRPGPSSNLQEEDGEERESQKTSEPRQQPQKARGSHLTNSNSKLARNDESKSNTFIEKRNLFRSERRTLGKDNHSRFTNRTTTIKMALLVILLLIGQASGQSVQISLPGGSVDTTATATAMPGIVENGVDSLPDSMRVGNSFNIVAGVIRGVTATSPELKVFAFYGLVVCQVRKGTIVDTKALAIQDPLKIYIGESPASASSAKIFYFTMSYSNPNWHILEAAQPALTTTPANGSLASFSGPKTSWPGTQIVYFGQTGAQMFELNFVAGTQGQEKAITGTGANLIAGKMRFMQKTATDGLLFATESNSNIYIVNRTNMQLTEAWTTTAIPTYGMTNNLDETQLLYILSNLMTVRKGELTSGGASVVDLLSHAVTEGNITYLLNFGSYNYLGVSVASAQPFMRILEKPTMTKMTDLAGVSKTNSFLNPWSYISGNSSFFGTFRDTGSFNFQSWQINFNNCLVRDAAFICQTCSNASMLKTSLAAYNQCIDQYSVPFRNGKDTSDSTYKPCATGCNNCLANYLNCTACDYTAASPNDYWLDGTVCVQGTAITGAKGKNTVMNGILTACQTTNCAQCKSDYRVCEACDAANDWWLNGTSCVNTAGIPLGMGKLGSTGKLAPCAFGCTNCQGNSTQCSVCDTSKDYWMLNNVCVVGGLLPIGFGRKIGTTVADMCVSGCLNCNANSNQCFSCDTSSGVDKWIRNQICVDGNSLPAGEGRNLSQGIISPCTAIGCQDCKTSHLTCALCDKPNGYWLLNNSCITEANISPGFGKKDSDGTIQPCSATIATGCLDCKSNFAACSKCDKDNDFWLDTGACVAGSAIASLKGRKLSNGTVDSCSVTGCLDCKTNTLSCTQCNQANGFWLDNGTCVAEASIGALKGKTPTGTLATCTTTGCLDCKQDYAKCAVCDKVNNWWLLTDTCVLGVLIPAGKGKRDSDGTVQPCSGIVGCLECQANHTGCTKCDQATDFWFDSGTCVQGSNIGALKGKTPTGTLATCTTTGCLDCKQDYAKCAVCDKVNNWWLLTDTCVLGTLIPEGKGKKDSDGTIQPCSATIATGCLDCKSNFAACSKCDKDNDFWLDTGACVAGSAIPSLKGRKLSNGTVDSCSVAGCLDCKTNTLSCTQCNQANGFWLDNGTCVAEASIGALKGKTPTGTLATCTTTGCLDCKQDYAKCAVCDKANNWWLLTDTCVLGVLIPAGKGKRDSDGTVQPCSGIVGCLECQANHTGCTKCDQATDFWFDSGTCVAGSNIPITKGRQTFDGSLVACQSGGCLDCKTSFSVCVECDKNNDWWLEDKVCIRGPNIGQFKGKNLLEGKVSPCTPSAGCLDCQENHSSCAACDTSTDWWFNTNGCIKGTTIPGGKGKNSALGRVESCSLGCLACLSDFRKCTQCNSAADFWLENDQCKAGGDIGPGKGRKPSDGTLASCTSGVGCLNCLTNNAICQICDRNNDWWLESGTCIAGTSLSPGKGRNLQTGMVSPCSLSGCLFCHADYTDCKRLDCLTSNNLWLDEQANICIPIANIPSGKGPNLTLGTVVPCASAACRDCGQDHLKCTKCDVASGFWLFENGCYQKSSFAGLPKADASVGLGVNYESGIVSPCRISNCSNCEDFFGLCAQCNSGYDLVNQLCTCKSASNCSECGPIPGSCTKCESNYLLIAGKCERPTEEFKLELHTLFFDLTKSEAEVTFRDMINTVNPEDLEITLIDLEESEQGTPFDCATVPSLETPSTKDCKIQLTPFEDGFKFKLAMSKQINKGKIVITPRRKSIIYGMNQKAVAQFPIEIKDVVYNESSTKKAMTSLAEGASATTNYAAIVANIVLIPFKGAMSVLLDYLLAEMLYLNLMNGPLLIYPSIILDALKDKNQPLPNIFQSWIGGRDCSVLDNFQRNGIACSIFDNFGSVILKLAIILLATTIITMITRAYFKKVQPELDAQEKEEAKQKYLDEAANTNPKMEGNGLVEQVKNRDVIQSGGKEQPMTTVANEKALDSDTPTKIQDSAAFKIMTLLATSFGMKFFVVQMEGLVLRIFRVSLVNLFSEPNDVTLAIGAIICFLIVGYYACYGYYILQFAKEARLQLENLDPKPDAIELSKTKKLCDKLNEKDLKYGMLLFLYQDLKFPSSYFHLYEPFARLMRALCIYICVIGFYTAGITQVIALLLVEIVYSTYIIKTRQKFLCWRNLLDVINRIGFVVYLILKLVSFIGFSEDRKQNIHGLVMAIVLLLLILTNLVIVIVAMIIMVINLIREKLAERKAAAKKAEEDKAKANNKLEVLADAEAVKIKNEEAQSARPLLEFKGPVIMGNVE
jgi:hypothetical protein